MALREAEHSDRVTERVSYKFPGRYKLSGGNDLTSSG
jgi:hypothetical protein